jgi:putative N6-adenine-specific DNA methylase
MGSEELSQLGAADLAPAYRGVHFTTNHAGLYRINYCSRLITRVLAPLISFRCHSTKYLQKTARSIPWTDLFGTDQTFAVFATVSNSAIRHSQYAGLCLKDAIVDTFREFCGQRPNIDSRTPDVWINLHIESNQATISLDASGGSLHRRGYRQESVEAPMQETVAAAIIRMTGWDGSLPLVDPMCGSGTLITEALMAYCRIPSGYLRPRFGFERLPDFDRGLWQSVKAEADGSIRTLPEGLISGSDISSQAVRAATTNARKIPCGEWIRFTVTDFLKIEKIDKSVIVCNPPYDLRLKHERKAGEFYRELGDFLKQRCTGCTAFIYFGNREWIKHIGLRPAAKRPLKSGGLDGRLVTYALY